MNNTVTLKSGLEVTQICFFHLRRLRQIRRLLGRQVAAQLASEFVTSRLDYGNATLSGLPQSTSSRTTTTSFERSLVCDLRPREHMTSALVDLHWLPVAARIEFKICVLAYQSLNTTAPAYISDMLQPVSTLQRQTNLRSATNSELFLCRVLVFELVKELSVQQPLAYGMNDLPTDIKRAATLQYLVHIAYISVNSWSSGHVSCIVCLDLDLELLLVEFF